MRVVAGEHMVRPVHVSATPGRNSYHRHIAADALELADGFLKRKVIHFGVNHNYVNDETSAIAISRLGLGQHRQSVAVHDRAGRSILFQRSGRRRNGVAEDLSARGHK
jgi:hypothetical protein